MVLFESRRDAGFFFLCKRVAARFVVGARARGAACRGGARDGPFRARAGRLRCCADRGRARHELAALSRRCASRVEHDAGGLGRRSDVGGVRARTERAVLRGVFARAGRYFADGSCPVGADTWRATHRQRPRSGRRAAAKHNAANEGGDKYGATRNATVKRINDSNQRLESATQISNSNQQRGTTRNNRSRKTSGRIHPCAARISQPPHAAATAPYSA